MKPPSRPRPVRPWHRVRQFAGALRPRVSGEDRALAYAFLAPGLQQLFESMTLHDQQHGIVVMKRVQAQAGDDAQLCAAALLHDCGKGDVRLWQRVLHVTLGIVPDVRERLALQEGAGWRRAQWRLLHHPALGADMAARAGADPDVVRMIRAQDEPAADARLAILQAADDA